MLRCPGAWTILTAESTYTFTYLDTQNTENTTDDKNVTSKWTPTTAMCPYLMGANRSEAFVSTLGEFDAGFLTGLITEKHSDDNRRTVYKFKYDSDANFFEVLEQYHGWGDFLSGVTILTIILYFVTSSDSGSLVVDLISAGGQVNSETGQPKDPHWIQRVLWSLTEGGLAIGLMRAGEVGSTGAGGGATKALRAMSIAVGLPFTIVLCYMTVSLYRMIKIDEKKSDDDKDTQEKSYNWAMPIYGGLFDGLEYFFSFGGLIGGTPKSFMDYLKIDVVQFFTGLAPFVHVYQVLTKLDENGKNKFETFALTFVVFGLWVTWWVGLIIEEHSDHGGWFAFANSMFVLLAIIQTIIRGRVRERHGIEGNILEDFCACYIFFFNVGPQNWKQMQQDPIEMPTTGTRCLEFRAPPFFQIQ